jgi:hypothetical protein
VGPVGLPAHALTVMTASSAAERRRHPGIS